MHQHTRRLLPSTIIATALTAAAALAPTTASAQAPRPKAIVSSTASGGMIYAGTDTTNKLTIRSVANLQGGPRFLLDDIVPITAHAGCTADPADATKASCVAFKRPDGSLREFHVFGRKGNDTIVNQTLASMIAHGEDGSDVLVGGGGADTLLGGPGRDDSLDGKHGPDILDGGPGPEDSVSYSSRTTGVRVTANDDIANDGEPSEGDNIKSSVEDIVGTDLADNIMGNDSDNVIVTGDGPDLLFGELGADTLIGGRGNDFLSSSANFTTGPVDDGAVDKLEADLLLSGNIPGTVDSCVFSTTDPDTVKSCEQF